MEREAEIAVLGPEGAKDFKEYWAKENLPFIGLPDPEHHVLDLYGQQVSLIRLGRMPAQFVVDKQGKIRFVHYGQSMRDIPSNARILQILDEIQGR